MWVHTLSKKKLLPLLLPFVCLLQKWEYVISRNPDNQALKEIGTKRQLEYLDVTPEELRQIAEGQKQAAQPQQAQSQPQAPTQPNVLDDALQLQEQELNV